jgi:ATP-dependent Lon protease
MSINENFLPILPLRDIVVFPFMVVPLFVGREKSIKALEAVMSEEKKSFFISSKSWFYRRP